MSGKKAVILFNLGGPDSLESVKPFLFNLFSDPLIIRLPNPFRRLLAGFISSRREKKAQGIYQLIGGKSPILEQTLEQANALEEMLETKDPLNEYNVFVCMRYWHPMTREIVKKVKEYNPDEIILLPLYPQFSTTTSESSLKEWHKIAAAEKLTVPTRNFCCYPMEPYFLQAQGDLLTSAYQKSRDKGPVRVLFSAHGLPESVIKSGDPYQWQIEQTAASILEQLHIKDEDHVVCYQSKVGPMKWLEPSTENEIIRAAKEGIGVLIVPLAFVSEHSETLVELDIEYRHLAEEAGLKNYERVSTVGVHPKFIEGLSQICLNKGKQGRYCSGSNSRICPSEFSSCPNNFYSEDV
jgi:ferrochelatase